MTIDSSKNGQGGGRRTSSPSSPNQNNMTFRTSKIPLPSMVVEPPLQEPSLARTRPNQYHRNQLLLSALALCALGLLFQMQTLQEITSHLGNGGGGGVTMMIRGGSSDSGSSHTTKMIDDHVTNNNSNNNNNDPVHQKRRSSSTPQFKLGDLYIPSMEFKLAADQPKPKQKVSFIFDGADCSKPVKEATWEWYNHEPSSSTATTTSSTSIFNNKINNNITTQSPRLLIALFAGYDKYAQLLQYSAHLAKVYASLHSTTTSVVILQGTAFNSKACNPPSIYTTLNKIRLLFHAIDRRRTDDNDKTHSFFDQVLLLDADALIVNMTVDITTLIAGHDNEHGNEILMAAQPVRQGDRDRTLSSSPSPSPNTKRHLINAGATLWNLHHPNVAQVALLWFQLAKEAALKGTYKGDQKYLQAALEQTHATNSSSSSSSSIHWLSKEFAYTEGTVVQHFLQRSSLLNWGDRRAKVQAAARNVCASLPREVCDAVPRIQYPAE